jgi:cyclophilin family peptidyl-prolyl cis-trans isomerase
MDFLRSFGTLPLPVQNKIYSQKGASWALFIVFTLIATLGAVRGDDTTYVKYNTVVGPIDVQLLSDEAPFTVENFLAYVDGGLYTDSIIHRAEQGVLSQGGSYFVQVAKSGDELNAIGSFRSIPNEFNVSNTRGTLSMGLVGSDINSATNGWFFNAVDNSATFDPESYTVFGRVANAPSLAVMDALAAIPVQIGLLGAPNTALGEIPLINYTVSSNPNSPTPVYFDNLVYVYSIVRESAPVDATISLSGLNVTANGVGQQPIITTNPPNLTAFVTYNGLPTPPTAAGSYALVASINSPGYDGSTTGTLVVTAQNASPAKATIKLTKVTATYDGNAHPVTATTTPAGLNVDILYNGSNVAPVGAGNYAVTALIDDPNFTGTAKSTVVIKKAEAGTFTINNVTATYDDLPHRVTATTTPPNLMVSFTYNRSATAPTTAGTYAVVGKIDDPNYTSTKSATGTLTISPVTSATVTVGAQSLPYDGKAQSATATTNPPGLAVTYTYNGSSKEPIALGTYNVMATVNSPDLMGTATAMGTLTIGVGNATVTFNSLDAIYTGKPIPVTVTTVPPKLAVTITYNNVATVPSALGSYTVTATVNDPNYTGSNTQTYKITPTPPTATTGSANAITATTATLNGTVDPKATDTTVEFQYGTTTSYGTTTPSVDAGMGSANVPETAAITGLTQHTVYHYRVVATSTGGVIDGKDKTFTTLAEPTFASVPATPLLSGTGAQIGLGVTPNGVATMVSIKYGTASNNLNLVTPEQSIGSGKSSVSVTAFLSGLLPGMTYYYELVTQSAAGSFPSMPVESFTTLGFDTSVVAMKGDTANGTGGATYSSLGDAAINDSDGVAFAALLTSGGGSPVITSANNLGIWADEDNSGTLHLLAQTGAAAPGTSATFASFGDPVYNENYKIAFGSQLKIASGQATGSSDLGVWSTITGSLQLVARQGSAAPGGSTFSNFSALGLSDEKVLVVATMAPNNVDGVTLSNDFGIWEGTMTSDLALLLRTGDIVGGKTIAGLTLASAQGLVGGQTRNFASNSGHLAALATFVDKTTGIVTVLGGTQASEALAYKVGDTASGAGGATYAKFSSPIINTDDRLAFTAQLTDGGGVTSANNVGIWAQDSTNSGTLQQVARTGSGVGTPFLTLSDPVYNNNEVTAFAATYKVGSATTTGIFSNEAGAVETVTQTGNQAPGCPSGVDFSVFASMALPDAGGVNGTGGVVFLATLKGTGVSSSNNTGIWIVDGSGTLQLVVRTGDTLLPGKTVTSLAFLPYSAVLDAQTRSFAKNGDLAFLATFSDKSTAIFNVQFP